MARPPARQPSVEIVEQPASKALRFRYECEGRSAGSIPGANNSAENKTYPTLRIKDYVGPCTIVASCVTKDEPFRPHPHNLVGRERCDRGVCTIRAHITAENNTVQFKNLGIQCVKKKEVDTALQKRAQLRVDPFRTGYDPRTYTSIELNSVRLAFQVFLPDASGQMRLPLRAVASDVINDKKAMGELAIVRASHCSGTARGGTQLILLTEKYQYLSQVSREEVTVIFYDNTGWKAPATVILVHKQVAIVAETPPYRDPSTTDHVNVLFRLQRGASTLEDDQSKPLPFEYIPEYPVKKRKTLLQSLIHYEPERPSFQHEQQIKIEPKGSPPTHQVTSPPHQQIYSPVSPYAEQQQRWIPDPMGALGLNPFAPEMQWQFQQSLAPGQQHYAQAPSPMHTLSPMGQASPMGHSPGHMGHASPGIGIQMGHVSPGLGGQMGHVSPGLGGQMGHVSPGLGGQMGQVSPALVGQMGHVTPGLAGQMGHVSPGLQVQHVPMGHVSPMGHISPGLQQPNYQQQMAEQQAMDTGTPSISGLLNADSNLAQLGLHSGDLFNLSSMGDHQNLSDSLKQLSTSDLQF